jgi:hypothetical protein
LRRGFVQGVTVVNTEAAGYVVAAFLAGVISTAVAREPWWTIEGLAASCGPPLLGAGVGALARCLVPSSSIPKWMFWFTVVTIALQVLGQR